MDDAPTVKTSGGGAGSRPWSRSRLPRSSRTRTGPRLAGFLACHHRRQFAADDWRWRGALVRSAANVGLAGTTDSRQEVDLPDPNRPPTRSDVVDPLRHARSWRPCTASSQSKSDGSHRCPDRPPPGAPPDRSLQAMQIHSARPSSVRAADPVADLAREFHCPGVAGHPAHPEQFQGRDGGLVRGGHRRARQGPRSGGSPPSSPRGWQGSCSPVVCVPSVVVHRRLYEVMVGAITWPPLWVTRGGLPNRDLRRATTPDRCGIFRATRKFMVSVSCPDNSQHRSPRDHVSGPQSTIRPNRWAGSTPALSLSAPTKLSGWRCHQIACCTQSGSIAPRSHRP